MTKHSHRLVGFHTDQIGEVLDLIGQAKVGRKAVGLLAVAEKIRGGTRGSPTVR